ncbi:MAG: citrate lyase beta subunit [halophilic archaeon J07HB67]|nr:MAG: citrate lyase beta subunit [halophilic archaeon J07HB67]
MSRRSLLFSPGDQPDLVRKAPRPSPDVITIDLEDAVVPEAKPAAREAVTELLSDDEFRADCHEADAELCVRLSRADPAADVDAIAAAAEPPDSVMLAKASDADAVDETRALLADRDLPTRVLALVENARGVVNATAIADHPATDALVFGAEDLAADVGATRTTACREVTYARQRVVTSAAAAEVDAIDTLYTDFEDETGLRAATETAVEFGYDGKMAIHPAQVDPINETFTPDPDRVSWAERLLAARDDAAETGRGVFAVDGEMVDAPLIAQAERVRERALAADLTFDPAALTTTRRVSHGGDNSTPSHELLVSGPLAAVCRVNSSRTADNKGHIRIGYAIDSAVLRTPVTGGYLCPTRRTRSRVSKNRSTTRHGTSTCRRTCSNG